MNGQKGILIVSFGTSYTETRAKTLDAIEMAIQNAFPGFFVCHAWTSQRLIEKAFSTDGTHVSTIPESLDILLRNDVTELYVLPTFLSDSTEYEHAKSIISQQQELFQTITFLESPLKSKDIFMHVVNLLISNDTNLYDKESFILILHNPSPYEVFKTESQEAFPVESACPKADIHILSLQERSLLPSLLHSLKEKGGDTIHLIPCMLTAGYHVNHDIFGENEHSFYTLCKKAGFHVVCHQKGLGEYKEIQQMFVKHLLDAL